jgi:hypothetical protein
MILEESPNAAVITTICLWDYGLKLIRIFIVVFPRIFPREYCNW